MAEADAKREQETRGRPVPAQAQAPRQDPNEPDTRDTNGAGGRVAEAKAKHAEDTKDTKVQNFLADGSVEETTLGALAETHGLPMGGPTVGDLNPAFAPGSAAFNGAADE